MNRKTNSKNVPPSTNSLLKSILSTRIFADELKRFRTRVNDACKWKSNKTWHNKLNGTSPITPGEVQIIDKIVREFEDLRKEGVYNDR